MNNIVTLKYRLATIYSANLYTSFKSTCGADTDNVNQRDYMNQT